MPLRNLRHPHQVTHWLQEWGAKLQAPAEMILIESAALLWHAAASGRDDPLPENSMDVDPLTDSSELAELALDAMIGSDFERTQGWHVNLMPPAVLNQFPDDWRNRCATARYDNLKVIIPCAADIIAAKLKRSEPRDLLHKQYAEALGLM
jgi:hypothetical protein